MQFYVLYLLCCTDVFDDFLKVNSYLLLIVRDSSCLLLENEGFDSLPNKQIVFGSKKLPEPSAKVWGLLEQVSVPISLTTDMFPSDMSATRQPRGLCLPHYLLFCCTYA